MNPFNSSNPARLDRRVTLLSPISTRDAGGGVEKTWLQAATTWADWTPSTGRELQQAEQFLPLATGSFRIRWRAGIDATWRVLLGDTAFEIIAPPVELGRRVYLDLVVRAVSGQAPTSLAVLHLGGALSEYLDLGDEADTPLELGTAA